MGATPAASRPPGGVVVRVGLDTYRPLALLAAAALVTPLHPLAYPILLVALGSARRRAHWDGWPFVPGRAGLLAVLTAGLAHDAVAGLTGTPGGLALLAHVPWLWAAPLPLPHWVADALWAATRP